MLLVGFRGTELDAETGALLADVSPGGVILFDFDVPSGGELPRNVTDPGQLRALIASLQARAVIPLFVAIDAEGGLVNRLGTGYGFRLIAPRGLGRNYRLRRRLLYSTSYSASQDLHQVRNPPTCVLSW